MHLSRCPVNVVYRPLVARHAPAFWKRHAPVFVADYIFSLVSIRFPVIWKFERFLNNRLCLPARGFCCWLLFSNYRHVVKGKPARIPGTTSGRSHVSTRISLFLPKMPTQVSHFAPFWNRRDGATGRLQAGLRELEGMELDEDLALPVDAGVDVLTHRISLARLQHISNLAWCLGSWLPHLVSLAVLLIRLVRLLFGSVQSVFYR